MMIKGDEITPTFHAINMFAILRKDTLVCCMVYCFAFEKLTVMMAIASWLGREPLVSSIALFTGAVHRAL